MANWQWNQKVKARQMRFLMLGGGVILVVLAVVIVMLAEGRPKKPGAAVKALDLTGIVEESFTDAVADHALVSQQAELESLKKQMGELVNNLKTMTESHQKELQAQKKEFDSKMQALALANQEKQPELTSQPNSSSDFKANDAQLWHPNTYAMNTENSSGTVLSDAAPRIHTVSFRSKRRHLKRRSDYYLNSAHYVPSNTSVRAVILGGADADASVNGQSKNNGVMLFKFLEDGTLPNGQRSRLRGCRVSANSYGDISSERAYSTLYRLSCAHPGEPIIDKAVTGWVFFNGKVGIKGKPLMRDGKVMTWAGAGTLLSSGASVAQMAQSYSQATAFGPASYVSPSQAIPYVGFGATAKTGDYLAQYYIKRAEQYHPVIQVGSGNVVTIVFKDGFYLEPDEDKRQYALQRKKADEEQQDLIANQDNTDSSEMNFTVPPEVLGKIDHVNALSRTERGAFR